MIRKPEAAERTSLLRRAAEAGLAGSRKLGTPNHTANRFGRGSVRKSTVAWLLGIFLFGLLSASSTGARLLGLLTMVPVCYVAWGWWKRNGADAETTERNACQGPLARKLERAGSIVDLLVPHPLDALDILTDSLERREERERENAKVARASDSRTGAAPKEFDPDEAFARYLAQKSSSEATARSAGAPHPSNNAGRTFGRRAL
jgi:hypothetical protein